jgi:1-acyl-sn-glycerol-3-phosphate acyltransferase
LRLTLVKIRVIHEEQLKNPGPVLMVVSQPAGFLDALVLVAAMERPVRCIIQARLIQGPLASVVARGLGMISLIPEERGVTLERCAAALAEKAALVTFVEPGRENSGGGGIASFAASIAVEAESRSAGELGLLLFPVHLFLPAGRTHTSEVLIDIAPPETVRDYISKASGSPHDQAQELSKALERRCQENSFRLQPGDLAEFLNALEQALRMDDQEGSPSPGERQQKLDGFELSRFVVDWTQQSNYLNPGLLVSLRESLEEWRQARRLCSLHRLEVEGAGPWLNWPVGRAVVWLESLVGFIVAFYGLINHLGVIALLYLTGLRKHKSRRDKNMEWLARSLIVLAYYSVAVFLVARSWGRRAAGLYAPSLPLSALYLWRYASLLRHQIRIAFLSLSLPAATARTRRLCRDFLRKINQALNHHAEILGLPH